MGNEKMLSGGKVTNYSGKREHLRRPPGPVSRRMLIFAAEDRVPCARVGPKL